MSERHTPEQEGPLGWGMRERGWLRLGVNHIGIPLYRCPECGEEVAGSRRERHTAERHAVPVKPGDRVRAVRFAVSKDGDRDPETGLIRDRDTGEVLTVDDNVTVPPGTLGTVDSVDDGGTLHVRWDNGSRLGLLPGVDQYEAVR